MGRPPSRTGISPASHREALWWLARGFSKEDAARKAGLSTNSRFYASMRMPEHADALRAVLTEYMAVELAPKAVRILDEIMSDPKVSGRVRVDAAKAVLDRSGYAAYDGAKRDGANRGELSDMSQEELRAFIDKGEAMLAAQAREVVPVDDVNAETETDAGDGAPFVGAEDLFS